MTKHLQSNWRFIPLFIALLMGFLGKTPLLAQNTYPEGALPGVFSVSGNTFVCFSQGNLQYIGSAGNGDENNTGAYWKFAEHQWDYLGDNGQGSDSKTVDRDLFCWGTSGYNHGANCYQPWSISESQSDYYAYGSDTYNLYDESGQADWGYNAISNGGNQENSGWRTLTHEEWEYLFNARNTASGIRYAMATVNNVNGMIILPDDWDASYYMLSNTNTPGVYSSNTISETEWVTLEQRGAVFLSAGGNRYGTSLNWVGYEGYYWSASYLDSNRAYGMCFSDNDLYSYGMNCYGGRSTRLVCPVQGYFGINATPNPAKGGVVSGYGTYAEGTECTLTATASAGFAFVNWTENDEVVSTEASYSFTVTGYRNLVANFVSESNTELGDTWYDWQSNGGPITRTVVWPDGKVNFAFTQALDYSFSDRGTGIGTYDAVNNEWIASEGRVENEKTGFGSIARYGENGIVVAAHTAYDCRIYLISDKENIPYNSLEATSILDNTYEPYWLNVMTSGANRDIIHVIATASDADGWLYGSQVYFRSTDGGNTWDKQNVILPFMGPEDCGGWQSNSCYWLETTDDNCLALVVNNVWSDGMVIYSYDDGETWQRKVFYKHPNPFGSFDEPFFYPRWTSCQWDSQHHLHVLYELGAVSGDVSSYDGMMNENYALGGVAYWNEDMPYNLNGTSVSAIEGNLIPGQPFVMDSAYLSHDIYQSWWLLSDAPHEMWPEYLGYLTPLTDEGVPEDPYEAYEFNIIDGSLHGNYYHHGVCGFPVLCTVPGTDEMVAVWSALDENHTDASPNYYYKIFASYSGDGGTTWSPMVHLTRNPEFDYSEFVYNQAVVVGRKLIIATQTDAETGTYVQGDEGVGDNNYYKGFVFDIDELFETSHQEVIAEGALNGVFSVGENATVRFSQGNLQYIGSAGNGDENNTGAYWKFAEHQWDYLGDNGQGSSSMTDDRDLFGWGTSGYNHGANCYQPWSTSTSNADYYPYGSYTYNLYDQTGQADWGYNAISNGGNQENIGWRTLTHEEWEYLFNTRSTSSGIRYAKAQVNNVNGVILLPDDWNANYYGLNTTNTTNANYSSNVITAEQWAILEQYGAVFLPAAGYRDGTSINDAGSDGYYWSSYYSSFNDNNAACVAYFGGWELFVGYTYRLFGQSVRLVRDVQGNGPTTNATQTLTLSTGINWVSFNVEVTMDDLKAALVEALPGATSINIKSQNDGTTTYNGTRWRGSLNTLDPTQMYMVTVPSGCELALEGSRIQPSGLPLTIKNGNNWMAFPLSTSMSLNDAFAGFNLANGDVVKSQNNGMATYNGTRWRGSLSTLEPGQGYIFNSAVSGERTLIFPN